MRAMAGRFDVHAQTVEDEARRMWASSQNIAGAGWSGTAQMTSYDTMGQMNQAFRTPLEVDRRVDSGGSASCGRDRAVSTRRFPRWCYKGSGDPQRSLGGAHSGSTCEACGKCRLRLANYGELR
jgi:Proteins of 100 residues with WXG